MPRHTTLEIPADTWTELTDGSVTDVTFQVQGNACLVTATTGSAPSGYVGVQYLNGQGEVDRPVADLAPGVSGADSVWCYALTGSKVFVSHA